MRTNKQKTGDRGEELIAKKGSCPECGRARTLKRLPANFKCADLICDFCGFLAQVKANNVADLSVMPKEILGAAWGPQKERMDEGYNFPLYYVLFLGSKYRVFYLAGECIKASMYKPRKPLSATARRAGWQGYAILTKNLKWVEVKF